MDPVAVITTALTAGAALAAKETASAAIKDGYAGLKALLKKRFEGKPEAEMALTQHEAKPDVWEKPLANAIAESGAAEDEAIVAQAQQLLKLINPQQASQGKYNIQFGEAKGVAIGDNPSVTMNFGSDDD